MRYSQVSHRRRQQMWKQTYSPKYYSVHTRILSLTLLILGTVWKIVNVWYAVSLFIKTLRIAVSFHSNVITVVSVSHAHETHKNNIPTINIVFNSQLSKLILKSNWEIQFMRTFYFNDFYLLWRLLQTGIGMTIYFCNYNIIVITKTCIHPNNRE